ncbi:MAG: pilus assembly protein PilM [Planctomycetota bacterium]
MSLGLGIDVGAATVTVAGIRKSGGGIALEHYRCYPRQELEGEGGPDLARLAKSLASELARDGVRGRRCVLGVTGRDAIIRYSHLPPMPEWRLGLLMQFEIEENAERIGEPLSADYRALHTDAGTLVLVALAKDARVKEVVDAFEGAGFEVAGAVPQPVAVGDAFRFLAQEPERDVTLVVDVGRSASEIALIEEGELIFARSVAQGGDLFTERLSAGLSISWEEAEELKRSGKGKGKGAKDKAADVERLLRAPSAQLASTLKASIDFARRQLRRKNLNVGRAVLAGGGGRIAGLREELAGELGCEVEVFDPLADVERAARCDAQTRETADAQGLEATTAAGLAISAVVPGATRLDLLPLSVKERLHFRHRTVWLYVSAALLAAALLVTFALALWQGSGESGRGEALASARQGIEARLARHTERQENNDKRERDLHALAERARPGFHLSALLARLSEVTPAQISFSEAELIRHEDVPGAFHFELSGLADDSQNQGGAAMAALQEELAKDPRIEQVSVQPQGDEGHSRRFKLTIVPAGNPQPRAPAQKEER